MVLTTWIIGLLWRDDKAYDRWFIGKFYIKKRLKPKQVKIPKVVVHKRISTGITGIKENFIEWLKK